VNEKTKYDGSFRDALSMDEYFEWQKQCISEMIRISKHYVFYNIQMITGNKVALLKLIKGIKLFNSVSVLLFIAISKIEVNQLN